MVYLFLVLFSVLVIVPDFAVKAEPNTIVVPDDYPTIQEAINNAVGGDTVFVKSGIYYEYLVVTKSICLIGENKETTIYRGNQSSLNTFPTVVVRKDGVNITGFTIKNDLDYPTQINIDHFPGAIMSMTGIHLISVRFCNIFGNIITDSGYGVWFFDAHNNNISDNTITNSNYGLLMEYSVNNSICRNSVSHCSHGLILSYCELNVFRDNILLNSSRNFVVSGTITAHYNNYIHSSNWVNGKRIYYLFNLTNVQFGSTSFPDAGLVYIVHCSNTTFRNLDVSNDYGLYLFNTTNSTIVGNNISNSSIGIWLKSCSGIIISENFLSSITSYGIRVERSERVVVEENSIVETRRVGVHLKDSDYNNISENVFEEIVSYGIYLESCSNNTLSANELTNCELGIALLASPENRIESNIISSTEFETANLTRATKGISVSRYCDNTTITDNIVTNCEGGIILEYPSYYILVAGNSITNCNISMQVKAYRSTFTANTISYSGQFAVSTTYGLSNFIYNNNFINNSQQVNPVTVNFWDNGINGNYWSDYNGTDNDCDGIGDTPHIIDYRNQDNYPLMASVNRFDVGIWEWNTYYVDLVTNSFLVNFVCDPELDASLAFDVHGYTGTPGFFRLTIPKGFMESENWDVLIDGEPVLFTVNEDQENTYLNFTYTHSLHTIQVIGTTAIPEFSSWFVLSIVLAASLLVVFCKKKLKLIVQQSY